MRNVSQIEASKTVWGWIGVTVGYVLVAAIVASLGWMAIHTVSSKQVSDWSAKLQPGELLPRQHEIELSAIQMITAVAQILGGAALIIGLRFTWKNLQLTEQNIRYTQQLSQDSQITERFGKAIEQLGSDRLEIRLGAVYALERIARDSGTDHWQIVEILSAFVRERGSRPSLPKPKPGPDADIQAVATVLGRRLRTPDREKGTLDLNSADFSYTNLEGLDFTNTIFVNARFVGAFLRETSFRNCSLRNANFTGAVLDNTSFEGADLTDVHNKQPIAGD